MFFILPVKVKWLAMITWALYGLRFVLGGWNTKLVVLASVSNFLLFFGNDIWFRIRAARRDMKRNAERIARENEPLHRCVVCGRTDRTNPDLDFRYCTECDPVQCYCEEHLHDHEHA